MVNDALLILSIAPIFPTLSASPHSNNSQSTLPTTNTRVVKLIKKKNPKPSNYYGVSKKRISAQRNPAPQSAAGNHSRPDHIRTRISEFHELVLAGANSTHRNPDSVTLPWENRITSLPLVLSTRARLSWLPLPLQTDMVGALLPVPMSRLRMHCTCFF